MVGAPWESGTPALFRCGEAELGRRQELPCWRRAAALSCWWHRPQTQSARKGGQAAGETRVSQVRPEGAARLSLMVGGLVLPRQAAWSSFTSVSW